MVRRSAELAAAAALAFALGGCDATVVDLITAADGGAADTDSDADTDTDTDAPADVVVASILVPDEFAAIPVKIVSNFYEHLPPEGIPDAVGASYDYPDIGLPPEPPYQLFTPQMGLEGPYYLAVVLFVEGGGEVQPIDGVDWVGRTNVPILLGPGTGTVHAPDIPLQPAGQP